MKAAIRHCFSINFKQNEKDNIFIVIAVRVHGDERAGSTGFH
jgi:hypothetical protein